MIPFRFRGKKKPLLCLNCRRPEIDWPRYFSDAFYQEHRCPSGNGHFYVAAARRMERYEQALRYMADYQITGTERTLHIDFQGKAREALDA